MSEHQPVPQPKPVQTGAPADRNAVRSNRDKSRKDWPELNEVICDNRNNRTYKRGELIGEGGFAKVYYCTDMKTEKVFCVKAMLKSLIRSGPEKEKVRSEIRINGMLKHPNIVNLHSAFEDSTFVYIILELCENKSMAELLRHRATITEDEAKYYLLQIIDAVAFCRASNVVHRDLKLANIFLTKDLTIKLGDFGLAAQLNDVSERKKTICGTPNYIAPEVLYDKSGHSFEVDVWAIGVILYTLLIGVPPFQTRSTKELYEKLKTSDFKFPGDKPISDNAKDLITTILNPDPTKRPTLEAVKEHPFFGGDILKWLPENCLKNVPNVPVLKAQQLTNKYIGKNLFSVETAKSTPKKGEIKEVKLPECLEENKKIDFVSSKRASNEDREFNRPIGTPNGNIWEKEEDRPRKISPTRDEPLPANFPKIEPPKPSNSSADTLIFEEVLQTINKMHYLLKNNLPLDDLVNTYDGIELTPPNFINKWIDHGHQYGLCYELADKCAGVFYKDATTLLGSPDRTNFEYLSYAPGDDSGNLQANFYKEEDIPPTIYKKYKVFCRYTSQMTEQLSSAINNPQRNIPLPQHIANPLPYPKKAPGDSPSIPYVTKFLRTRRATLFRLSNRSVQMNFKEDHVKVIFSQKGLVLSIITPDREIQTYRLLDIMREHYADQNRLRAKAGFVDAVKDIVKNYSSTPHAAFNTCGRVSSSKAIEYIDYAKGVIHHILLKKQGQIPTQAAK